MTSDTPPPADGSTSSAMALKHLYPRDNDKQVDFQLDSNMSQLFENLQEARLQLDKYKQQEELFKQQIQEAMGDATKAVFSTGTVSWKRSRDSVSLDTKQLLADQPELLTQYGKTRSGSRRFLIQT